MSATPNDPILRIGDPELEWKRYERFCLDLVRALPDVREAHLYGTRGEDQEGIDIHADLIGGGIRTIQCRRVQKFGKGEAEETIGETTYETDEHEIWATCQLSTGARKAVNEADGWEAKDIEQISSLLRGLPREQARWLVEDHLGAEERKRFLGHEGDLAIVPARIWFARGDDRPQLLGLDQELRGREAELAELSGVLADEGVQIAALTGRSGIGKSRLLRALADQHPERRMLVLRPGVGTTSELADQLPLEPFDLIIDDASQREDLLAIIEVVLAREELETLILASSPQSLAAMRATLAKVGASADAIRVVGPLSPLEADEAEALAAEEIEDAGGASEGAAAALADLTRDVPALCVLGARLLASGKLSLAAITADETVAAEILGRFGEEKIGKIDAAVDPALAARALTLIAVLSPVDLGSLQTLEWLAAETSVSVDEIDAAIAALEAADLLGGGLRKRVVPELFADHLLHEACVSGGVATDFPDRAYFSAPEGLRGHVLRNLAELSWQLRQAGGPEILDAITDRLQTALLEAAAWPRERLLEALNGAAAYLGPWVVRMAGELLDHPAAETKLFGDFIVTDRDARIRLVPLLAEAGLDPEATEAAMNLLWEVGADGAGAATWSGEKPLDALRSLASYRLPLRRAELLLDLAERLLGDTAQAEARAEAAASILSDLVTRDGRTSVAKGNTIHFGGFYVNAEATAEIRDRLRSLLAREALQGGERTRVICAELLTSMLRQPRSQFASEMPAEVINQWRPEQLALIEEIERIFAESEDPLVARRLRDGLRWHAEHSAIEGVREAAAAVLESHPPSEDELLIRSMTHSLAEFHRHEELAKRRNELATSLLAQYPEPGPLLERIDAELERLRRSEPETAAECASLLVACAALDVDWALAAARILAEDPARQAATALGSLTTVVLEEHPDAARELVSGLARGDKAARRIAAAHVAQLAWAEGPAAPERKLAIELAGDDDPGVVRNILLAAHRLAESEPDLAREIVLSVPSLAQPQIAEEACMALHSDDCLTAEHWERLLGRLREAPEIEYWHEQILQRASGLDPELVVDHLLARILEHPEEHGYFPLPHERLGFDPFAEAPTERRGALQRVAGELRADPGSSRGLDLARLFWSLAAETEDAFELISAMLGGEEDQAEAAATLIAEAGPRRTLARPQWVAEHIEKSAAGEPLDQLRGALRTAFHSRTRQGTAGQPFPEDVALLEKAKQFAFEAPTASRTERFWLDVAASVEVEIHEELRRDQLFEEE